jgi:hypothetical protein
MRADDAMAAEQRMRDLADAIVAIYVPDIRCGEVLSVLRYLAAELIAMVPEPEAMLALFVAELQAQVAAGGTRRAAAADRVTEPVSGAT